MKKFLFVIIAVSCLSFPVFAQVGIVSAPILEGLMTSAHAEEAIYYAQMIAQTIENAKNTYDQIQATIRAEQRALQNLQGFGNISSWDDFMDWYNRQLYLEKATENAYKNTKVIIGENDYRLDEIDDIKKSSKETYVDYWKDEFSPDQRRKMWNDLGLTPANYIYLKTWENREQDLLKGILTRREIVNQENMEQAEKEKEIVDALAADKNKPEDEKLGEKSLLQMLVMLMSDTNKNLRDLKYADAEINELKGVQDNKAETPENPPILGPIWNLDPFKPIVEK